MKKRPLIKRIIRKIKFDLLYERYFISKDFLFNVNKIRKLKNKYLGKRVFIIGGGPSINDMDLNLLNNEYTIVVNRGFLLKNRGLDKATIYGISDENAIKEYGEKIDSKYADIFFSFRSVKYPFKEKCVAIPSTINIHNSKNLLDGFFQMDISRPVSGSYTVVLYMLQVAVWLGFKDIYFIGVDNNFGRMGNIHWYNDSPQEKENMIKWNFNPSDSNNICFSNAFNFLKGCNINIYNAGVGGELNSIPRVDYESLFRKEEDL